MRDIVGIVGDARQSPFGVDREPIYYIPYRQLPWFPPAIVVRASGSPAELAPAIRSVVGGLDRQVPVDSIVTMRDLMSAAVAPPRMLTVLLGLFATIALILTSVGLYGVVVLRGLEADAGDWCTHRALARRDGRSRVPCCRARRCSSASAWCWVSGIGRGRPRPRQPAAPVSGAQPARADHCMRDPGRLRRNRRRPPRPPRGLHRSAPGSSRRLMVASASRLTEASRSEHDEHDETKKT